MREELEQLPRLLTAHLALTLFPLFVGTALSLPLGVLSARSAWLGRLALNAAGVVQTVPSLALLALMVPLLGALGASGIGYLPAFLALVVYSVLPILRNTVTGLGGVDPAVVEAAKGVGMNEREQLLRVELPLAMPVIVAGVRTAAVWTVGAATLATPVGADSLGNYIFSGLQTRNVASVLLGCAASAALALALDGLGRLLLLGITRPSKKLTFAACAAFAGLYLYAGVALATSRGSPDRVSIGAKTFTEQYVLSEILRAHLVRETGATVIVKQSLGSSVAFDALVQGDIDAYVDYSGTIWSTVMKRKDVPGDREVLLTAVRDYLAKTHGIELVAALGFENSYALAMRRQRARELGARRLSELGRLAPALSIGGDYEFFGRPEWKRVRTRYRLEFRRQTAMDSTLLYEAVRSGVIDVASAFSTDGRIAAMDLVVLEDDRRAIPPYDAIILASRKLVTRNPRAVAALRRLAGRIDVDTMRRMNMAVDIERRTPRALASNFVEQLSDPARAGGTSP